MLLDPQPGPDTIRLVFPADPMAVRAALDRLFNLLPRGLLDEDARGTAQIVITEVLNNVVEHAYADGPGEITLSICPDGKALVCSVTDQGVPMPWSEPSMPRLPDCSADDLPEGGFGWFLILSLAERVRYQRLGQTNLLTFRLPTNDAGNAGAIVAAPENLP